MIPSPSFGRERREPPGRILGQRLGRAARLTMSKDVGVADFAFCGILGEGEFGRVMMGRKHATSEVGRGPRQRSARAHMYG